MLILKRKKSQKFIITGDDLKLRDEVFKRTVWKHTKRKKGYVFTEAHKSRGWDGRVQLFRPTSIRAGYLEETLDVLNNFGTEGVDWKTEGVYEEDNPFNFDDFYNFCKKMIKILKPKFKKKYEIDLELRDYQVEAAWKFICQRICVKTGIALHATSAGKSLTIAFIVGFLFFKNIVKKAVILVPLQSLVTQFHSDLLDYGFKPEFIGKLYSKEKQTTRPITIAMNNSTSNLIDTLEGEQFFNEVDLVICDEVHRCPAKTVTNSILEFNNAKYFFGCTGTLPEDELEQEVIFSMFGNVLDKRKLKELKEDYDAVTPVKVGILNFKYGLRGLKSRIKRTESAMDWHEEVQFLQDDDEFRNPYVVKTIANNFRNNKNIIVLVKNLDYGKKMLRFIQEELEGEKEIFWIEGSMKLEDRDEIINHCKESTEPYIIVTNFQIFSTGINMRNISAIFLIDPGKSKITVAQTIGRGVRKHQLKDDVLIIDCSCDLKYGNKHGNKRKKLYAEEGFMVMEKNINKDELKEMVKRIKS